MAQSPPPSPYDAVSQLLLRLAGAGDMSSRLALARELEPHINWAVRRAAAEGPAHAFNVIDSIKSAISRDLLVRRRMPSDPSDPPQTLPAIDRQEVVNLFRREPDLCVVSLYQTPENEFWAFILWQDGGSPRASSLRLTGVSGRDTYHRVFELTTKPMWRNVAETENTLDTVLNTFGDLIIPHLLRLHPLRRVLIIPHKRLHSIPLHLMRSSHLMAADNCHLDLDHVSRAVLYSSSLMAYMNRRRLLTGEPSLLACIDAGALPRGDLEVDVYKYLFSADHRVHLATSSDELPASCAAYGAVLWACHGCSVPTDWGASMLAFGNRRFSAAEIARSWKLDCARVVVLSACETGVDASLTDHVDDYFGLDMAVHVAGAESVVSTMWKVHGDVALLHTLLLVEAVLQGQLVSTALKHARHLQRSGCWRSLIEASVREASEDTVNYPEFKERRIKMLGRLLEIPIDEARHERYWGVYRCFGGW